MGEAKPTSSMGQWAHMLFVRIWIISIEDFECHIGGHHGSLGRYFNSIQHCLTRTLPGKASNIKEGSIIAAKSIVEGKSKDFISKIISE